MDNVNEKRQADGDSGERQRAIVDGLLRYLSVSSIKKFDPRSAEGCPRAWYYRYVLRMPEPQRASAAEGVKLHDQVDRYLTTGERAFGQVIARGLHLLPPPGPDLEVELEISGKPLLSRPLVFAGGVPLRGRVDLMHRRGLNYGDPDGDERDPDGTVEIADHKFVGGLDYALARPEIIRDTQMAGYGMYALARYPDASNIRLSLNYFVKKGYSSTKRTVLVRPDQIRESWETKQPLAREIVRLAQFRGPPEEVPPNTRACGAYGGCAHASYCAATRSHAITQLFGAQVARSLVNPEGPPIMTTPPLPTLTPQIADAINKISRAGKGWPELQLEAAALFGLAYGQPTSPTDVIRASGVFAGAPAEGRRTVLTTGADIVQLAAELERAGLVPPAPVLAPAPGGFLPVGVAAPVAVPPPAPTFPAAPSAPVAAPPPPAAPPPAPSLPPASWGGGGVLSPETPASDPALASIPITAPAGVAPSPIYVQPAPAAADPTAGLPPAALVPDAPEAPAPRRRGRPPKKAAEGAQAALPEAPAVAPAQVTAPPEAPDTARPQVVTVELPLHHAAPVDVTPPSAEVQAPPAPAPTAPEPVDAIEVVDVTPAPAPAPAPSAEEPKVELPVAPPPESQITLYVDAIPRGAPAQNFRPHLDRIAEACLRMYGSGAVDIRAVPDGSPMSHGRWRGYLAAAVAGAVRAGYVPAGVYYLDARTSEVAQIAAEALSFLDGATGVR